MATYAIGLNVVPRETLDVRIGDAVYMQIHVCMYLNFEYKFTHKLGSESHPGFHAHFGRERGGRYFENAI